MWLVATMTQSGAFLTRYPKLPSLIPIGFLNFVATSWVWTNQLKTDTDKTLFELYGSLKGLSHSQSFFSEVF